MLSNFQSPGRIFISAFIIFLSFFSELYAQQFLSNLSADKNDAVFTTYAAPMERSNYIIDEGYHFNFSNPEEGISFSSEHSGSFAIAFKMNGGIRYALQQMYSEPIITTSYSDLVKYHYEPFQDIKVDVFFQVYSSGIAIQNIDIRNMRADSVQLDVYPFFRNDAGMVSVKTSSLNRTFEFYHREPADGWTTGHNIPHQTSLGNVYLTDQQVDAVGVYSDIGNLPVSKTAAKVVTPSDEVQYPDQNYAVEWGEVYKSDGSLCSQSPPGAQQIILLNGNESEILTENAPKWGDPDPNVPGNGYQGAELGNFKNPEIQVGDTFTVIFTCGESNEQGIAQNTIDALPSGGIHTPVHLTQESYPAKPGNVTIDFNDSRTASILNWEGADTLTYDVYRRTSDTPGRFDQIANDLNSKSFLDTNLDPLKYYSYLIIAQDKNGRRSPHSQVVSSQAESQISFSDDLKNDTLSQGSQSVSTSKLVAFQKRMKLNAGATGHFRVIRAVDSSSVSFDNIKQQAEQVTSSVYDMNQTIHHDENIYSRIPAINVSDKDWQMMYYNAFSLMRQVMMPPEGQLSNNYYVFSREPTWGWGHGGQVFHESLAMLAYVFMDGSSAQQSQRVFMETQGNDGYINYRTGPYLNEQIPSNGERTTSAPWYSWENWEIYQQTGDKSFLKDAYDSGVAFYNFWIQNRDKDNDGLAEWGGHAVLECVRDGQVATWDQVGWPSNFEALDLNTMLVKEAESLGNMARALGDTTASEQWMQKSETRSRAIEQTFWDENTGFFYNVDKADNDFTFKNTNDLKRKEIIGFLPLWAGTATKQQADRLVQHLTNNDEFWRPNGIPTLSADDPYYNPRGYWNGPVWVQWDYLIFRGLLNYGYTNVARQLAQKVLDKVAFNLKRDHTFWELYDPDSDFAGLHQTYIWTGIVARMMIDLQNIDTAIKTDGKSDIPGKYELKQNYPNPFNPTTTIRYTLPASGKISLKVYDALGRVVSSLVDKKQSAGVHVVTFNGQQLHSGIYFYQLETPSGSFIKKMTLIK